MQERERGRERKDWKMELRRERYGTPNIVTEKAVRSIIINRHFREHFPIVLKLKRLELVTKYNEILLNMRNIREKRE